ncbi:MAG: 3-phosphoshikimate 1-carboxyvinyltransferase [Dehalococcoidia bacterium]|nr:3-phosphoshikimate 1-carboxyvinyltransferase [Dehalococcoidia bacterium]
MERRVKGCASLRGEIAPPGDKSISHRAVILNSIAWGRAKLENFAPGDDCFATVSCLRALGVEIIKEHGVLTLSGVGREGFREPTDVLNARNSATTIRLLAGLLAAQPFLSIVTGDESLRSRPMGRLIHPLRLMGAEIWGRGGDSLPPLAIRGNQLKGIDYHLPVASAQLKSALLIAALFAQGETTIEEPAPSRDHTERLLRAMGAKLQCDGTRIALTPYTSLSPVDVCIPGDISSAAFWLVAGAIHPNARIKVLKAGVNPTRSGIIDVLLQMGAKLRVENERMDGGEPVADMVIESSDLVGTQIAGSLIPRLIDEIPLVALAGSFARGTTTIRDAQELRVKESDRIGATVRELSTLGADIDELPDGMIIHGGRKLEGGVCSSHRDHRLAMTLGIAGLVARGETVIHDAEAVAMSYPSFWQDLERLTIYGI